MASEGDQQVGALARPSGLVFGRDALLREIRVNT